MTHFSSAIFTSHTLRKTKLLWKQFWQVLASLFWLSQLDAVFWNKHSTIFCSQSWSSARQVIDGESLLWHHIWLLMCSHDIRSPPSPRGEDEEYSDQRWEKETLQEGRWSVAWSESVSKSPGHLKTEQPEPSHRDQAADVIPRKEVCWNFRISKDFLPLASRKGSPQHGGNNNKSVSEVLLSGW